MAARTVALVLAIVGLTHGLIAWYRDPRSGSRAKQFHVGIIAVSTAIIVGTLPIVLGLGERIRIAASILSILINIATIILFVRHSIRAKS